MKRLLYLLPCFFFFATLLPAQTAAELEELLDAPALNYEQAAGFVLRAADVPGFSNSEEAFRLAEENNWLPKKVAPCGEASLEGVSLLIMRSFDLKGGIFYNLFKTPHYAYRELVYKKVIHGRIDPEMSVPGELLLYIVSRVLSLSETEAVQ